MTRFREKLSAILPKDWRPFVCHGSPYDKTVCVVGHNPATKMENGFWRYWDDCTGFDKDAWFKAYKNERRRQKKRPVSATRRNLNKLNELVDPVDILETNVYSKASSHANELRADERVTKVLDFLLAEINPKLIVTHGKRAATHFSRKMRKFDDLDIEIGSTNGNSHKFVSVPHAIYWSDRGLEEISNLVCQAHNV